MARNPRTKYRPDLPQIKAALPGRSAQGPTGAVFICADGTRFQVTVEDRRLSVRLLEGFMVIEPNAGNDIDIKAL